MEMPSINTSLFTNAPFGIQIFLNPFPVKNLSCACRPGVLLSSPQPLSKEHAHGRPRGSENCTSIKNLFKYLPSQKREFRATWPHPLRCFAHYRKCLEQQKWDNGGALIWRGGSPFLMIGWSAFKGKQMWRRDNCSSPGRGGPPPESMEKSRLLFSSSRATDSMQFGKMQHKLAKPCSTAPWHQGVMSSDTAESAFSSTVWKVTGIRLTSAWRGQNALKRLNINVLNQY